MISIVAVTILSPRSMTTTIIYYYYYYHYYYYDYYYSYEDTISSCNRVSVGDMLGITKEFQGTYIYIYMYMYSLNLVGQPCEKMPCLQQEREFRSACI